MLLTAGFIGILTYVQKQRDSYLAEKDAVYRHYIELHPEDFPVPGKYFLSNTMYKTNNIK